MNNNYFEKNCKYVEEYLAGERNNPMICTNKSIAKQLERKYHIKLVKTENVNVNKGLYMYCIN